MRIHFSSAGWLIFPTLFGMPVGLAVLIRVDARLVKAALAIIIVAFSAYSSPGTTKLELKNDSRLWLVGCGFSGSILGGAYGMNGPPLVVRGAMRRWSARHFRATLQGYLLPASPHQHGRLLARWSLGAVCDALLLVVAAPDGRRHISWPSSQSPSGCRDFSECAYAGLIGIGTLLLVQALRG